MTDAEAKGANKKRRRLSEDNRKPVASNSLCSTGVDETLKGLGRDCAYQSFGLVLINL